MKKLFLIITVLFCQQMTSQINVLIHYTSDMEVVKDTFNISVSKVPEMIEGTYSILIANKDDYDEIETFMEQFGDVIVIGSYYINGIQFVWNDSTNQSKRKHTIKKYKEKLRNKKTYDTNGNVLTDEPYTELEALNVHVNKFMGHQNRIIN